MRISFLPVLILLLFSILVDIYILKDIRQFCKQSHRKFCTVLYSVFSIICWIFIIIVFCFPYQDAEKSIVPMTWMIFSYLSVYISKFVYAICSLIGRIFRRKGNDKMSIGSVCGIISGFLVFGIMWYGALITRRTIDINRIELISHKLPPSFDGFKIVQLSDMHLGTWGNDTTFISKMVDSINSLKPDLVLFTGDFVNRRSSEMLPFVDILSRISARHGTMAVLGNHDYGGYVKWKTDDAYKENLRLMDDLVNKMGWKLLKNQNEFIGIGNDSIVVIGVENWGEPPFNQLGDLGKSYPGHSDHLHGLNDSTYKILMTHNPEHWNQVVTKISNVDLSLSGHTHAMQMMLKLGNFKWSPSSWRYKNWGGLYETKAKDGNPMNLYVNIGVGEVGFPARIGTARPELTEITLHAK